MMNKFLWAILDDIYMSVKIVLNLAPILEVEHMFLHDLPPFGAETAVIWGHMVFDIKV